MRDNLQYNRKVNWVQPAAEVIAANGVIWTIDRFLLDRSYARVNPHTWHDNIKKGWEWDNDKFSVNFIGHPYSGSLYFNAARSNGYNFFQSVPFVIGGSLMWEYFGETTRPSYNDLINTTVSGTFLGELFYRFSSKVLNDKTCGSERILREVSAAIINPVRSFNRLIQGKTFRRTDKEVYQKEPLNFTFFGGIHYVNAGTEFVSGPSAPMLNFQLDYGDPFEIRSRKPFDVFRLRVDLSQGSGMKLPNIVNGYALLNGKNHKAGNTTLLNGGYQHYDCWNNKNFELATAGFGPGLISKTSIAKESDLYTSLHLAAVPLSAVNVQMGEDTSSYRNYNYGAGFQGKLETTLNLTRWISLSLNSYYYWIHSYVGYPAVGYSKDNAVGIFQPKLAFWFSRNISVGIEQFWYHTCSYTFSTSRTWTEQKFFLQVFLENPKRIGSRYN